MTPFWSDDHLTLYGGDCRAVLAEMPAESVHCVVTSPPYWGLRDYGVGGQLGLEPTPEEYVANMVAVFREVRRVLRADGTLWLNLGDSYAGTLERGESYSSGVKRKWQHGSGRDDDPENWRENGRVRTGLKPKDLCGIPWRVAFALQADGWYLRSDIIWAKPNPMPESVTDRPTKAHEYLFLLTRSPRYYFDAEAVREPHTRDWSGAEGLLGSGRTDWATQAGRHDANRTEPPQYNPAGRNLRSVWTIATEPYPGAHFATFPRKLVEPCVKAGTSEKGVCPECGAPWVREVESTKYEPPVVEVGVRNVDASRGDKVRKLSGADYNEQVTRTTTGWSPSCKHDAEPVPATVLDPFAGSGTTLFVAQALGRRGIGIDLSPDYLKQALDRNRQTPLGLVG